MPSNKNKNCAKAFIRDPKKIENPVPWEGSQPTGINCANNANDSSGPSDQFNKPE